MTANLDRLSSALSRSYRLERELGQACPERTRGGGRATGYLAADLKRHRKVAVKVLTPGLAHRAVRSSTGSTAEPSGGRHGDQA
jgi:hypothetical protein